MNLAMIGVRIWGPSPDGKGFRPLARVPCGFSSGRHFRFWPAARRPPSPAFSLLLPSLSTLQPLSLGLNFSVSSGKTSSMGF